jgi:probable rRNA maturation factor
LGDIAISVDRAKVQAHEIGQPLEAELRFLCLHGLLHLLGYDHETDNGEMLALQTRLKHDLAAYF